MTLRHAPQLRSTSIAFVLSLLVHLVAGLILSVQTIPPPAPVLKRPAPSKPIPLLSQKELRKLRQMKVPKATKEQEKKQEKSAHRRKQIVEIPPPPVERIPTTSRFLAEFNSAVKQETVHRVKRAPQAAMKKSERLSLSNGIDEKGRRKGKRIVQSKPSRQISKKKRQQPKKGSSSRKKVSKQNKKITKKLEQTKIKQELKQGEGPFKNQHKTEQSSEHAQYGRKEGNHAGRGRRLSPTHYQSLLPTLGPQNQARVDGSLDHIENMKQADQTALNTTEYRYAFFFNRVKRAVSERWRPANELMRIDPRGQVYGVRDRETVIAVTLRPNGSIVKAEISKASGIPQLDREALSAFLRAQPFHNPPAGLVEKDGLIRFKFGFYLEIGSRRFRLFR